MDIELILKDLGVRLPSIPDQYVDIDDNIIELNNKLKGEYEKILAHFLDNFEIPASKCDEYRKLFDSISPYSKEFIVTDSERYNELNVQYFKLNKQYAELEINKLDLNCDDYEMDYIMRSELYQAFHEDPDKRRARLEGPIQRKIDIIDKEIDDIKQEQEMLESFQIQVDDAAVKKGLIDFYTLIYNDLHSSSISDSNQLTIAYELLANQSYKKGIAILKKLAKKGMKKAQQKLGDLYSSGTGVKESDRIARKWYNMSSNEDS